MSDNIQTLGANALVVSQTDELQTEANGLMEHAKSITVKTHDDYQKAGAFFASIKAKIKEVEAERTKRVKPLNDTVKLINADFKGIADQLEAVLKVVEKPMLDFKREEERQRREAEEAARKERERLEAEARAKAEAEMAAARKAREEAEAARKAMTHADDPLSAVLAEEEAAEAERRALEQAEAAKDALRDIARVNVTVDAPAKTTAAGTSFRKTWSFEIEDADAIPRALMIPDEKALGLIARTDKEDAKVPGVRFFAIESIGGR